MMTQQPLLFHWEVFTDEFITSFEINQMQSNLHHIKTLLKIPCLFISLGIHFAWHYYLTIMQKKAYRDAIYTGNHHAAISAGRYGQRLRYVSAKIKKKMEHFYESIETTQTGFPELMIESISESEQDELS